MSFGWSEVGIVWDIVEGGLEFICGVFWSLSVFFRIVR